MEEIPPSLTWTKTKGNKWVHNQTDNTTHSEQCRQKRNKFESSISTFDFSRRDEKSRKEVFILSKQIFANLLKIRRSSFSKSACFLFSACNVSFVQRFLLQNKLVGPGHLSASSISFNTRRSFVGVCKEHPPAPGNQAVEGNNPG